jgi:hypothetical protein
VELGIQPGTTGVDGTELLHQLGAELLHQLGAELLHQLGAESHNQPGEELGIQLGTVGVDGTELPHQPGAELGIQLGTTGVDMVVHGIQLGDGTEQTLEKFQLLPQQRQSKLLTRNQSKWIE